MQGGFRVDRSPPPLTQLTVARVVADKGIVEFTLDGDAADPTTLSPGDDPSVPPHGGKSPLITFWWEKGSMAPDRRPVTHPQPT